MQRVGCTPNPFLDPEHVDNGDYTCTSGSEFYRDNELSFPQVIAKKIDTFYRTYYGYGVAHNGRTWCKCDACMRISLHRNTGAREPSVRGREERYRVNQRSFIHVHRKMLLCYLRGVFSNLDVVDPVRQVIDEHANPHPKRELRVQAFDELLHEGWLAHTGWMNTTPEVKMKTEEIAKTGKKGRTIADLGVRASLRGAFITEQMKTLLSEHPLLYKGTYITFVKKPDPEALTQTFHQLLKPRRRREYFYHSDDSCFSAPRSYGNCDISNCDGSHTEDLFELLVAATPEHLRTQVQELVDQCASPIRVKSVSNPAISVTLTPLGPKLLSGSTLTTLINNLANILIGVAYAEQADGDIVAAAFRAGYAVTSDVATQPEDLQFLKHSPVQTIDGDYAPMLNLGVLLRLTGSCKRDLPGRGDLRVRAGNFQKGLLQGVMAHATFPLLADMRARVRHFDSSGKSVQLYLQKHLPLHDATSRAEFADSAVFKRYKLTDEESYQLTQLANVGYGEIIGGPAFAKVLTKDYGLSCNDLLQ